MKLSEIGGKKIREYGFGKGAYGKASILAGPSGEKLDMQMGKMPSGCIYGEVILVPTEYRTKNKSYITDHNEVYLLELEHLKRLRSALVPSAAWEMWYEKYARELEEQGLTVSQSTRDLLFDFQLWLDAKRNGIVEPND